MSRGLIIYLYLAILLSENKSDSLSSRSSLEDLLDSYASTVLPIPERKKQKKKDPYEFFNDFRTTNHKRHPEIFRDDFNVHVENMNKIKTTLNFQRDGFPIKLSKNTGKPKIKNIYPSAKRDIHFHFDRRLNKNSNNDFLVKTKVDRFNDHKSLSLVTERGLKLTQTIGNLEASKRKMKHKRIQPHLRVSEVQDTSHVENLKKRKENRKSKEYMTSQSSTTVAKKLKHKHSRLSKRQQTQKNTDLLNELLKSSELSIEKKSQLDIALKETELLLNDKQHEIQNKKRFHKHSTDFVNPKSGSEAKNVKQKSKSGKNDLSFLTMFDMDEEEDTFKSNNAPLNRGSPLQDTIPKASQNKKEKLRSMIIKKSSIDKQQPIEIGMTDENEQYDLLDDDFKSTFEALKKDVYPGEKNKLKSGDKLVNKLKNNIDISKSEKKPLPTDNKSAMKLDKATDIKQVHPKIAKKHFDVSLNINENNKEDKLTDTKKKIDLNDTVSKAEIMLADSDDSDENSNDETDKEKKHESIVHILRYSKNKLRGKKSLKKCRKACSEAFSIVCRRIHCSSKAKRDLKRQCKKSCVKTFGKRKHGSE